MSPQTKPAEDSIPEEYAYEWSEKANIALEDFLTKYKPSMVQNDGTKPWIWVRGKRSPNSNDENMAAATNEASDYLKEVSERVEAIKNDAAIPMRSNKKTGAKSKKEVREQVQADAAEKLKEISVKYGYVWGKWLIFAPSDKVDSIWSNIARSLVSGPLAATSAFLTKVATSPEFESPNYQHVICLYIPDVYDKDSVTATMKVLLRNHGVNLSGVKSDMYTAIGLDSKHPSGIPSTVWKNTTLLKDTEIKELKDAFFSDLSATKSVDTVSAVPKNEEKTGESANQSKRKPVLKKKAVASDPFASDNDDEQELEQKEQIKPKKAVAKPIKRSQEESEDEQKPKTKKKKAT
ncbi:hypothetical protein BJ138DRAFT_1135660 [Hygrophoropsis aurantiaca]|uniref:Uncharacterized protein n=1 Tax=Hygrophoropsis aurantiaca TaxID=72124 RepID=A0ACB8ABZ4_9AGAM|nr:hypothetical protein BJ138DRAFT_1135660 [Hygrophoropsis aurantiaca]